MADIELIKSLRYGLYSAEEIESNSNALIYSNDLYTKNDQEKEGGLLDPRIQTEFGHIDLQVPIFNPLYFDEIFNLTKVICYNCANIVIKFRDDEEVFNKNTIKHPLKKDVMKSENKTKFLWSFKNINLNKNKLHCPFCNSIQPTYKTSGKLQNDNYSNIIFGKFDDKIVKNFTPEYIFVLFKKITDDNLKLLGFCKNHSHPSSMILHKIPVLPKKLRPTNRLPTGITIEDNLMKAYAQLIDHNKSLKSRMNENKNIEKWRGVITDDVFIIFDNKTEGKHKVNEGLKTLGSRIQGNDSKSSRILNTLLTRRTKNSGRSVIIPDASMDADQIGIPLDIAKILTIPEKVTNRNIKRLKGYTFNNDYPNIKEITPKYRSKPIKFKNNDRINIGDIVHRNLIDDDFIIVNRQPSLHKKSILCHRVRIHKDLAIRLNPNVTEGYNADFDGDEMNVHIPQSIVTSTEINCLASVERQTMSSALNEPSSIFIQDNVLAFYNLYKSKKINLSLLNIMNVLAFSQYYNGKMNDELMSTDKFIRKMIPADIKLPEIMNKKEIKNLISSIFHSYDNKRCYEFFNTTQKILNLYMTHNMYSVSPRDSETSKDLQKDVDKFNDNLQSKIDILKQEIQKGTINTSIELEVEIMNYIEETKKDIENAIESNEKSRFWNLIDSKSKGKISNMSQIKASIGQQINLSKRIGVHQIRTLPHVQKYDISLYYNGYIKSSFSSGLEPDEYFFHCIGGREGIVEQALSTGESGYIQKQLVNYLQDLKIGHNNTVVDSSDRVYNVYGDDNFDGKNIQNIDIKKICNMTDTDLEEEYLIDGNKNHSFENLKNLRMNQMNMLIKNYQFLSKNFKYNVKFPINISNILQKYINENKDTDLTVEIIEKRYEKLIRYFNIERFHFLLLAFAHPKQLLKYKLNQTDFKSFTDDIEYTLRCCMIDIGEAVGLLSATSIGEPTTQATINSFHNAGAGRTMGVPRLRELFRVQKNIERKSITNLYLKKDKNDIISYFDENMKDFRLSDIVNNISVLYSSDSVNSNDKIVKLYKKYSIKIHLLSNESSFKFIIVFKLKDISLSIIKKLFKSIDNNLVNAFPVYIRDENCIICQFLPMLDLKNQNVRFDEKYDKLIIRRFIEKIEKIPISGIETYSGINKVDKKDYFIQNNKIEERDIKFYELNGSNLIDLFQNKYVDKKRTFSNNIYDVNNIFGIEATLNLMIKETGLVLDDVDLRHFNILFNSFTRTGYLQGLQDVIQKESDENENENEDDESNYFYEDIETSNSLYGNTLTNAATSNILKNIKIGSKKGDNEKISSNFDTIIIGQCCKIGSGDVDIKYDI